MMKIEGFVTTYKADDGRMHVYFFPGRDDSGHVLCKMFFLTKNIDYLYTRQSDGAIDYIINDAPATITFRMTNIQTGEYETYNVEFSKL